MRPIALATMALCLGSLTAEAATLRVMTTLHTSIVRLSDLFENAGGNADRVLGPGPGAGGRIVVESAQLGAIARQFGVDWRPASSADRAVLERPGKPLRREDVMTAVRAAVNAVGASADCDIDLADFASPIVPLEVTAHPVVFDLAYDGNSGRFSAMLSVTGEAMDPVNLRIGGRVDDTMELPVTTTRLPAGSVLHAEDIHMARVHASLVHGEVARRVEEAVGMQLKHQIGAGLPLAASELARPSMVQKGARVLMLLDSPGIALTAQGQAQEAGAVGERIHVSNPTSHAVVEAEVIGPDRVRVAPTGQPRTAGVSEQ